MQVFSSVSSISSIITQIVHDHLDLPDLDVFMIQKWGGAPPPTPPVKVLHVQVHKTLSFHNPAYIQVHKT